MSAEDKAQECIKEHEDDLLSTIDYIENMVGHTLDDDEIRAVTIAYCAGAITGIRITWGIAHP